MKQERNESKISDIYTVFIYRYVFDTKNDIVDLRADVYDLQYFPERLLSSYQAEWKKYNKKAVNERGIDLEEQDPSALVNALHPDQQQELSELLKIIENTTTINASKNIKVIKTELKTYIESLLKL